MPKKKATEAERLKELSDDALRFITTSRRGRRFLWELMGKCGLGQNPFSTDRSVTDFNCGRLSVATALLVDIDGLNSDAYSLMSRESKEDRDYARGDTSVGSDGNNSSDGFDGGLNLLD